MHPHPRVPNVMAHLPARLTVEQTANVLGFQPHDIPVLVAAGLLSPLGRRNQAVNTTKYFAAVDIDQRRIDAKWLSKATDAVQARWSKRRLPSGRINRISESRWPTVGAEYPPALAEDAAA